MPEVLRRHSAPAAPSLLRVAHVRRAHGIRGEVRVQSLGGGLDRFRRGTTLLRERGGAPLTVTGARSLDGDELLLTFAGVDTREGAAALSGEYLCVEPERARPLGADEWFVWQLVGLEARTVAGDLLGVVVDVESHPASDILVVRGARGEDRYPMVRQWIQGVDIAARTVTVTPWAELSD